MYYLAIKRRDNYSRTESGEFYANYRRYLNEITEDCIERCVYCDISLKENGGEGMQLDHFRPQHRFPELSSSPFNLVLACAKCNRLKSKHWPTKKDGSDYFLDPFAIPRSDHFQVKLNGEIESKCHSSEYMVGLMSLNRRSRCLIRMTRRLKSEALNLLHTIEQELILICESPEPSTTRIKELAEGIKEVRSIINEI